MTDIATLLSDTPLFADVDTATLHRIAQLTDEIHIAGGATLMNEGDPGDCFYLVVSGRLQVFSVSQGTRVVAEIGQHETVGEMAMLTGGPRSATIRALRDSRLIRFSRAAFDRLVTEHPRAMMHLARLLVVRFQQAVSAPTRGTAPATIAVAAAGSNAPLRQFAADLVRALAAYGPTLHLTASVVDSLLGTSAANTAADGAGNVRLAAWLSEQEQRHSVVVYEADDAASEWTRRCLRQADRVLFIARAESSPEPLNEVEAAFWRSDLTTKSALALVHEPTVDRPSGTERWLLRRRVDSYHHLRRGVVSDVERIARHLLGRTTSVVLSGGGARGFAHIGVLRALDEAGIPVDLIGGASQGAIIGALYAFGHDYRSLLDQARRHFVERGAPRLRDCTLPIVSLFDGRRSVQALKMMFGEARIEDLWLNYFCVSSNITRASCEIHRTGVLHKYLRASAGIPGFFPPFPHDGDLLVDGGVLNNVPVDVARQLSAGTVIAVDATAPYDLTTTVVGFDSVSGWRVLLDRLNPFSSAPQLPNMAQILSRTATLASIYHREAARHLADLYLQPPVERIGLLEWKALNESAEIGYRYAAEQIAAWQRGRTEPTPATGSRISQEGARELA